MKIQGLKQLDQNSYDSISISEDRAVISGKEIKTVPLMARFSDELRGKTDKEIQNLIVDQFLDYSRISYVSDDYSRLRGNVVYAGTEPGRLLILNDVADEEMKAKIFAHIANNYWLYFYILMPIEILALWFIIECLDSKYQILAGFVICSAILAYLFCLEYAVNKKEQSGFA